MEGLGERIRKARMIAGLTQDELADATGLSRVVISRYEKGKTDPSATALISIADALGITVDSLIGRAPIIVPPTEDQEILELREELRKNPQMRILFDISKKSSVRDIRAAVAMLKSFEEERNED